MPADTPVCLRLSPDPGAEANIFAPFATQRVAVSIRVLQEIDLVATRPGVVSVV